MDLTNEHALAALDAVLAGLLPALSPPLTLTRQWAALRVSPAGLGGYVGQNADPIGPIVGRRIEATLQVSIAGGSDAAAATELNNSLRSIFARGHAELRGLGILRVTAHSDTPSARNAQLALTYEYLQLPEAPEGVIEQLDLTVTESV